MPQNQDDLRAYLRWAYVVSDFLEDTRCGIGCVITSSQVQELAVDTTSRNLQKHPWNHQQPVDCLVLCSYQWSRASW